MSSPLKTIKAIDEQSQELTQWRRHIHANPEIAFEEVETSAFIAEKLESFGIEVHRGIAKTGLVGVLKGKTNKSGRSVALRADMDALPMSEENQFDHKSQNPGKMHGCGHDGHSTMLLGAAQYLSQHNDFDGTVYFIFQPAEEDQGGADQMVREGLFEKFDIDEMYGLHNWPDLPVGEMSIASGPVTASSDSFQISIKGKGGHAAMPNLNIDVVSAGSALVQGFQMIIARIADPLGKAVISTTIFQAGEAKNVMAETARLGGTVRTFGPEMRERVEQAMRDVIEGVEKSHGVQIDLDFQKGYPSVINDEGATAKALSAAKDVVGDDKAHGNFVGTMGAEDFAYFTYHKPAAYILLGQGKEHGELGCAMGGLHSPHYDFNDKVLSIGASYWARLVEKALS